MLYMKIPQTHTDSESTNQQLNDTRKDHHSPQVFPEDPVEEYSWEPVVGKQEDEIMTVE